MPEGRGALPSQMIRQLMESDVIVGAREACVNPASLDLVLTDEMYRVSGTFLPRPGESVEEMLPLLAPELHHPDAPMECGVTYLARLAETIRLPSSVYGYANPKSSTGRDGAHVRLLADGVPRYDTIPLGWSGSPWVSVIPKVGPIRVPQGETLLQVRLFSADTRLSEVEAEIELDRSGLLYTRSGKKLFYRDLSVSDHDGSLILSIGLRGRIVGWEWVGGRILDFGKRDFYDPTTLWRPVRAEKGFAHLRHGRFYILSTEEYVRVPPHLACEMASMDDRAGEFRSHRAGFIDPGWGWGTCGEEKGAPLTLEVEPFEDLIIRHGQPFARIKFERMASIPDVIYGTKTSHYLNQRGPKLSKRFK